MADQEQRNIPESSRVAMIAMARQDAGNLSRWEDWANGAPPTEFQAWARQFADDPTLWKGAPPAEVAALLRIVEHRPGWLDASDRDKLTIGVQEQLGDSIDQEVLHGSRVHAVDEIRKAQNPGLAQMRAALLDSLDDAFAAMQRSGAPVQTALAKVLHERGLVTLDAELGEPVERIETPVRNSAAVARRFPPALGVSGPQRSVDR